MRRILLTGMSATGKSTLTAAIAARGYKAVDLDTDASSHWADVVEAVLRIVDRIGEVAESSPGRWLDDCLPPAAEVLPKFGAQRSFLQRSAMP